jgi:hypothetical protein
MEARKRCARCRQDKPVSQFYSAAATAYGDRRADCKACSAAKCRAQRAAYGARKNFTPPRDKRCQRCKAVRPSCEFSRDIGAPDGLYGHCKTCGVWIHRCRRYGLKKERVWAMLRQTRCEACGADLPADSDKHIDHRHADGAVRGVLCDRCNTTLGKCEENPEVLMGICRYIARTMNVDYRKQPYLEQEWQSPDSSTADTLTPEGTAELCQTNTPHQPTSP